MGTEVKHSAGMMDLGVDVQSAEISIDMKFQSLEDTYNVSSGIRQGFGPRFGMALIPGHGSAANEQLDAELLDGLAGTEGAGGDFLNRRKFYNILPVRLGAVDPTFLTTKVGPKITAYAWLLTNADAQTGAERLWPVLSSILLGPPFYYGYRSDFRDGFHHDSAEDLDATGQQWEISVELMAQQWAPDSLSKADALRAWATIQQENKAFVSSAQISVSGQDNPTMWTFGQSLKNGDATHAANVKLWTVTNMTGFAFRVLAGLTTDYQYQNYRKIHRNAIVYGVTIAGDFDAGTPAWAISYDPSDAIFVPGMNYTATFPHFSINTQTAILIHPPVGAYNDFGALIRDSQNRVNSAYQAILAAPGRAYCTVFQEWIRSKEGLIPQFVDLVHNPCYPQDRATIDSQAPFTPLHYRENKTTVRTCFRDWPSFTRGTAMTTAHATVRLGSANTGILRSNRVYEFTFSYFNKRLNFESNVGTPVKFQTGATDLVALNIFLAPFDQNGVIHSTPAAVLSLDGHGTIPFAFAADTNDVIEATLGRLWMNYMEYRFYYREEGDAEWSPALFIDAAHYWFFGFHFATETIGLQACATDIAGLPGGRPGGFIDYSRLPDDEYNHVLQYKDRAWWFSEKSIIASLRNNIFSYPIRNSLSIPTGSLKGGLVHNFPGQSEQTSRLIIYGTKSIYVARFTGIKKTAPVKVSENTIGDFEVDFSDLDIDSWTTNTAFSWRSAIIADGFHYYWGPQGIFFDNGVDTPYKKGQNFDSTCLEPDLFNIYDPADIDNIHAHYNSRTKEITWFYKPKVLDLSDTHGLIYNTRSGKFYPARYRSKVDLAGNVTLESADPVTGNAVATGGARGFVSVRNDASTTPSGRIQRGYFYDEHNRSGDGRPETDLVVRQITIPVVGQRRLIFDPSALAVTVAAITVGDRIALHQVTRYTTTAADEQIARVMAVNSTVTPYHIDVLLPEGATLAATAILPVRNRFPIWDSTFDPATGEEAEGLHGIKWQAQTNYWAPTGIRNHWHWLWAYVMHKLSQWKVVKKQNYQISYRTPQAPGFITDKVGYDDNSDGHWQMYHPLRTGNLNAGGQALKLRFNGIQIGSELTLQYLEAHCNLEDGNVLKTFESLEG